LDGAAEADAVPLPLEGIRYGRLGESAGAGDAEHGNAYPMGVEVGERGSDCPANLAGRLGRCDHDRVAGSSRALADDLAGRCDEQRSRGAAADVEAEVQRFDGVLPIMVPAWPSPL
jgi:hypothetical protein